MAKQRIKCTKGKKQKANQKAKTKSENKMRKPKAETKKGNKR